MYPRLFQLGAHNIFRIILKCTKVKYLGMDALCYPDDYQISIYIFNSLYLSTKACELRGRTHPLICPKTLTTTTKESKSITHNFNTEVLSMEHILLHVVLALMT